MSGVSREDSVLKLVHPGRFVEIHTKPVAAAEILKKYPRRSVTRPDIFDYPWVVVNPDSVLELGKVFFIVPNRTIYKLMKAHRKRHHVSPSREARYQDYPSKSNAGLASEPLNRRRQVDQSPPSISCTWTSSLDRDRDSSTRKQNKVGAWPEVLSRHKPAPLRLEDKPAKDSRAKHRLSNREEYHNVDPTISEEFSELEFDDSVSKNSREVTELKSCLRKPDSDRKLLQLKVSFLLPSKDVEQQRRVKMCREELSAGNNSRSFADFFVHNME